MARAGGRRQAGEPKRVTCQATSLVAALGLACMCFAACGSDRAGAKGRGAGADTLTIGFPHITGEDPLHGMQQAARSLSLEALTRTDRNGRSFPRLAERWTESADGLTWRFTLKANALFHDGSPVEASAVKRSLEDSLASPERDLLPGLLDIVGIETPDPHELVIKLRDRSAFLLDDLSVSITKSAPGAAPIGTGAYVIVSDSNTEIVMKAFPRYYRGDPEIDQIIWKSYPAVRTAWAGMMRGQIDALYEVGQDTVEFVRGESSVAVFSSLRPYVHGIIFNSSRPMFRDPRVRRALNYAVDRRNIVEQALKGHGMTANGPVWPEHWAYDANLPSYPYDAARATALLDTAVLPVRGDHREAKMAPGRLHFTCLLPENFALWERMALFIQRNLSEVGVEMRLETLPFDAFNRRVESGDFDALFLETVGGYGLSKPYFFWHSTSKRNVWGYRSTILDRTLDAIRHAASDREYRDATRAFQQAAFDDPPAIFLAWGETTRAVSRRFQVQQSEPNGDVLVTVSTWRVADSPGLAH